MRLELLPLDPATYVPHSLHDEGRAWIETNCYIDFWIEVLHAFGFDPVAAAACTLSSDFEGDQWTMFKFPTEDLRELFGLEVRELNVWRPLLDHLVDQLGLGHLVTIDVDAWFLPDTVGMTYRQAHQKTTIAAQMVDEERRVLGYFHNAAYFELDGEDFDGVLHAGGSEEPSVLPPYVEQVRFDRQRHDDAGLPALALEAARRHLLRRPDTNPVDRFGTRLAADLDWLREQDLDTFHRFAFGTCRQCGANAELAASFADWLDERALPVPSLASEPLRVLSEQAKALQFALARVVRGRSIDLDEPLDRMARAYDEGIKRLVDACGV